MSSSSSDPAARPSLPVHAGPARLDDRPAHVRGGFVERDGARWYRIEDYDRMPPFFVAVVSDADHWLYASSTGALTAGRRSPDHALFPYDTVDKIHDAHGRTGGKTLVLVRRPDGDRQWLWEPFSDRHAGLYAVRRSLYKSVEGDALRYEETNEDLGLTFTFTWATSDRYGFVRRAALLCHGDEAADVRILDGVQNLMPYGLSRAMQRERSVLGDAYKKNELLPETGLGLFTLSAQPVDRAEPSEALLATTVWCAGLQTDAHLLSARQLDDFRAGRALTPEHDVRAERGAYLAHAAFRLEPGAERRWMMVADIEQDAAAVVALQQDLADPEALAEAVDADVQAGTERLRRLVGAADGDQRTADRMTTARHYMNVLFNIMRGGVFDDGYTVERDAVRAFVAAFNTDVAARHADRLAALPDRLPIHDLLDAARSAGPQLERLCHEYLPLIFSRRHGDPSRPWNHFTIDLRDEDGHPRRAYEGNWRDIFQNWEALGRSFPGYLESFVARFVNASTADGYNPYRITSEGIDWEKIEPDDPWSYIGYWGDHQIVYLLRLLEASRAHHPGRLEDLLARRMFAYADVPYRIRPYSDLLRDPHTTIDYDDAAEARIEARVERMGADGKLLPDDAGDPYLVTLGEKLLVTLLAKLTNFVPGGGLWLNTQRPEWNDANNALVGYGISMVTLYHLRRYVDFLDDLFAASGADTVALSEEVADLLAAVSEILGKLAAADGPVDDAGRRRVVDALGEAGAAYRARIYDAGFTGATRDAARSDVHALLGRARTLADRTIEENRRADGLYHSYNLLDIGDGTLGVEPLYEMLEGQVAVLDAEVLAPEEALALVEALRASDLYRADQHSYLLYPDRRLPRFLEKNRVPFEDAAAVRLLRRLLAAGDRRLVTRDARGDVHFNGTFRNRTDVEAVLDRLAEEGRAEAVEADRAAVLELFERTFNHRAYTGRSGTFFGYEGLGSIYWHMVSKLILAVQRAVFGAHDGGADAALVERLGDAYYDLRAGLGGAKTPETYGAFPLDPYSHTPGHAGAKQPGMTGQVKEDVLCRLGELGVRVADGRIAFDPVLLRAEEFLTEPSSLAYFDVDGRERMLDLDAGTLGFTLCGVPVVYRRSDDASISVFEAGGEARRTEGNRLDAETSGEVFRRTGRASRIEVAVRPGR